MKILLREYNGEKYVWETAKYRNGKFYVDGSDIAQTRVISIVNDNRKNYVQCSCCGEVFRRGDHRRFQEHKENAIYPETCFGCPHLSVGSVYKSNVKYTYNPDGTFCESLKREVELQCSQASGWSYAEITSDRAIRSCKKRQCANAVEIEIEDFFTQYPGVFDDIITIDALLDAGHNVKIPSRYDDGYTIVYEDAYEIQAVINTIGIISSFNVFYQGDWVNIHYSKKYDKLFRERRCKYEEWNSPFMDPSDYNEIKAHIAKLYR